MAPPSKRKESGGASSGDVGSSSSSSSAEMDSLMRAVARDEFTVLEVFYVNCTVIDATAAVYKKVRSKLSDKLPGPRKFREKAAKGIASKASQHIPTSTIAEKMSKKIPQVLMYKLAEKGLKLHA